MTSIHNDEAARAPNAVKPGETAENGNIVLARCGRLRVVKRALRKKRYRQGV